MFTDVETVSEWRIRQEADVSVGQLRVLEGWSLIQRTSEGRWPVDTIAKLKRIKEEARHPRARQLPRRVVRLRADYVDFPVPASKLREAMLQMLGQKLISAPKRKLNMINRAVDQRMRDVSAQLGGSGQASWALMASGPAKPNWIRPEPKDWRSLLADSRFDLDYFESSAAGQYSLDDTMRKIEASYWPREEAIPLEERIMILVVRQIAIDRARAIESWLRNVKRFALFDRDGHVLGRPVRNAGLSSPAPDAELYVELEDDAWPRTTEARNKLTNQLAEVVNPHWRPADVRLVKKIPDNALKRP